ncbi:hypothetical protein [Burkholderia ubonensis]|uniref:hypothetical protein n=1 Tax=Burkholderia ubonensis TaxID=101571 RepID=UPI0011600EFF|nr:hypothetical protein [Burkholderia ubonensis]
MFRLNPTFSTFCLRLLVAGLALFAASSQANPLTAAMDKLSTAMSDLPRYEKLPLFNPHRKTFTCVYQDQQVPAPCLRCPHHCERPAAHRPRAT